MDFEEEGDGEAFGEGGDGGVEAFEVADLEDAAVAGGGVDEGVGFGDRGGDGFFDEDVDAGGEEGAADGGMGGGGYGDDGGIDEAGEFGEGEGAGFEFECGGLGVFGVRIADGGECGVGEGADDAHVIAAEGTGTDDGEAEFIHLLCSLLCRCRRRWHGRSFRPYRGGGCGRRHRREWSSWFRAWC